MRALVLVAVAACTHAAAMSCPDRVPPAIAAGDDQRVAFVLHARGTQDYACVAGAWSLVAPAAELADDDGAIVGRHGAGPSWELTDGSKIVGAKLASAAGPDGDGAVPWLLVGVSSHTGTGRLTDVTRIQRMRTSGGVAPAGPCSDGATIDVPYTADYYFYVQGDGLRCGI
ncbi:MAG TPA: DUF3455 domain-containing protein [Kofleriaceae bacterium]|nr:DUF3455 domain-containing protein [Kofleriaceae bacterium]